MARSQSAKSWVWILIMAVFLCELLFYTWCRVQSVRVGYEISEANDYQTQLIGYRNHLGIELASLKSPQRIVAIARQQLQLVMPTAEQTVVMP